MQLFKTLFLFSSAVSAAVTLAPRDAAETRSSLEAINTRTQRLTNTVNGWDGSPLGAITINSQAGELEDEVNSSTNKASDESVYTSAQSRSLLSYVTGTLEPSIQGSLDAIVRRRADFAAVNLENAVRDRLASLRTASGRFGDALVRIASADQRSSAQAARNRIDSRFADAQARYA